MDKTAQKLIEEEKKLTAEAQQVETSHLSPKIDVETLLNSYKQIIVNP